LIVAHEPTISTLFKETDQSCDVFVESFKIHSIVTIYVFVEPASTVLFMLLPNTTVPVPPLAVVVVLPSKLALVTVFLYTLIVAVVQVYPDNKLLNEAPERVI